MLTIAVLENIELSWLILWLIVGGLSAWRLTNIAQWEKIFSPVRGLFGIKETDTGATVYPDTFWGKLFSCFWCISVWVSFGVSIVILVFPWILIPFSISAIAIILEKLWDN